MKKLLTIAILCMLALVTIDRLIAQPEPEIYVMTITILKSDWDWFKIGFLKQNPVPEEPPAEGQKPVAIMSEDDWVQFRIGLWAQGQAIRGNEEIENEKKEKEKIKKDYIKEVKDKRK